MFPTDKPRSRWIRKSVRAHAAACWALPCAVRRDACCIACHNSRAAERFRGWAFPSLMVRGVVSLAQLNLQVGGVKPHRVSVPQSAYYTVRFSIVLPSPQVRCGTHWRREGGQTHSSAVSRLPTELRHTGL